MVRIKIGVRQGAKDNSPDHGPDENLGQSGSFEIENFVFFCLFVEISVQQKQQSVKNQVEWSTL